MIQKIVLTLILISAMQAVQASNLLELEIQTQKGVGKVLIRLLPDVAPKHVVRIKKLTTEGAYNNVAFHRVIAGFMAQTGDIEFANRDRYDDKKAGTGGSEYPNLYAELSEIPFTTGVVGMARNRYIHSANSQFFIMTATHPSLNSRYTVIGVVEKGLDWVRQLKSGSQTGQGKVNEPDYIIKASLVQ